MNLMASLKYVIDKFDVFEHFNLYGVGLCVNSSYRGRGIATELLKARVNFLKALDLTVTSTLFTTIGSQKAAASAGYDLKSSTSYEEMQEKFPEMDFSHANTSHCQTLTLQV